MKRKLKVVCFVDDDPVEVQVFKNVFNNDFIVIADTTLLGVLEELKSKRLRANLFVLDLYFAEGKESSETDRNQMIQLKEEVDRAQERLTNFLGTIGQSREGGLKIMRYIRENYPITPIVFFTRKGTLSDAIACMEAGADGIFLKAAPNRFDPTGDRLTQLERAALEYRNTLTDRFFCKASTSNIVKKLFRISKFIWNNWWKL